MSNNLIRFTWFGFFGLTNIGYIYSDDVISFLILIFRWLKYELIKPWFLTVFIGLVPSRLLWRLWMTFRALTRLTLDFLLGFIFLFLLGCKPVKIWRMIESCVFIVVVTLLGLRETSEDSANRFMYEDSYCGLFIFEHKYSNYQKENINSIVQ